MNNPLPLLAGPYGWASCRYASISLHADDDLDDDAVAAVLRKYSCHPPAIPRILNCLRYSNRYDCYLQYSWFRSQHEECRAELSDVGIRLVINFFKDFDRYSPLP